MASVARWPNSSFVTVTSESSNQVTSFGVVNLQGYLEQ